MTDETTPPKGELHPIIHFGSINLAGKSPGTYQGGIAKLYGDP